MYFLCFKFCGVGLRKTKDTAALEQTRCEAESWRPGYHVHSAAAEIMLTLPCIKHRFDANMKAGI